MIIIVINFIVINFIVIDFIVVIIISIIIIPNEMTLLYARTTNQAFCALCLVYRLVTHIAILGYIGHGVIGVGLVLDWGESAADLLSD